MSFLVPDAEYNARFAARLSDYALSRSIIDYESGPMTDNQRALYEAMRHEVAQRNSVEAMKQALTDLQTSVLAQLRAANCPFVAEATERHWRQGEAYYIDDRVSIPKRLRAAFNKANPRP